MRVEQEKNTQFRFEVRGEGQPVVLVHGLAASLSDWDTLLPEMAQAGFRTYALDLLGHGGSPKPDAPILYSMDHFYRTFADWMASFGFGRPLLLVGHSLGGYLSLLYCLDNPGRVHGLVLIDPLYSPTQVSFFLRQISRFPGLTERMVRLIPGWLIAVLLRLDPTSLGKLTTPAQQQIAADIKRASPHIMNVLASVTDLSACLSEVDCPTLVIWGEKDLSLDPNSFMSLVARLPQAVGQPVSGSGHQPHITQPDKVNRLVVKFAQHLIVDTPQPDR